MGWEPPRTPEEFICHGFDLLARQLEDVTLSLGGLQAQAETRRRQGVPGASMGSQLVGVAAKEVAAAIATLNDARSFLLPRGLTPTPDADTPLVVGGGMPPLDIGITRMPPMMTREEIADLILSVFPDAPVERPG